jgi:hypothetical protein
MITIKITEGVAYVCNDNGKPLGHGVAQLRIYYRQQAWALAHEGWEVDYHHTDECSEGDQCRSWHASEKCKGHLRPVALLHDPNEYLRKVDSKRSALKFYEFMRDKTVFDEESMEPHWQAFVKLNTYDLNQEE